MYLRSYTDTLCNEVHEYRVIIDDEDNKVGFKRKQYEEDYELKAIRTEPDEETPQGHTSPQRRVHELQKDEPGTSASHARKTTGGKGAGESGKKK